MCDQTCIIVSAVVGGIVFVILLVLAIWCFLRVSRFFGLGIAATKLYTDSGPLGAVSWLDNSCPDSENAPIVFGTLYFTQIRKKRQQGGVYNPQEMENKDYKRKGNIDINSISMQVQPERLI